VDKISRVDHWTNLLLQLSPLVMLLVGNKLILCARFRK